MKNITLLLLLITLLCPVKSTPQSLRYPVGIYGGYNDNSYDNNTYLIDLHSNLGVTWIMHPLTVDNASYFHNNTNFDVHIANNALNSTVDKIPYYTSGLTSIWEAENGVAPNAVGLKHGASFNGVITENYYSNNGIADNNNFMLSGPNHYQRSNYPNGRLTFGDPVIYHSYIRIRFANAPPPTSENVLRIESYTRVFDENMAEDSVNLTTQDFILTSDEITTEWKLIEVDSYSYTAIDSYPEVVYNQDGMPIRRCSAEDQGISLELFSLTNREFHIDYIEFRDEMIWIDEVHYDILTAEQKIKDRANESFFADANYLHSADEPTIRQGHIPYNLINSWVKEGTNNEKEIFTTFYPQWNNSVSGEEQFPLFKELYNPSKFLFYYYPVISPDWDNPNNTEANAKFLGFQRNLLHKGAIEFPDFMFTVQAHGFYGTGNHQRKPTVPELHAQVNNALAFGAKGIFFYNFASSDVNYGLYNPNENPPLGPLYYEISNVISPRLINSVGPKINELEYQGEHTWHHVNYNIFTTDKIPNTPSNMTNKFQITSLPGTGVPDHFLVTWLKHKEIADSWQNYYFYITNLATIGSAKTIDILASNPSAGCFYEYNNFNVFEEESDFNESFTSSETFSQDFSPGEGKLYRVSPMVNSGGTLLADDEIITNITLENDLYIPDNLTLTISDEYIIEGDIYLAEEGTISTVPPGNIVPYGTSMIYPESWSNSLVVMSEDNHPKIIWGVHPDTRDWISTKIYKKINAGQWSELAEITYNPEMLYHSHCYVDETETIVRGQSSTTAFYYVRMVYNDALLLNQITSPSNTVDIDIVGGEQGKINIVNPGEFALEQNFPNPFNPATLIYYQIAEKSHVNIEVYDMLGEKISTLVDEIKDKGSYEITFDGSALSSGMYMYKITAGKFSATKKMLLVK